MSYAQVLVEIDLLEELQHSVEISLPEGPTLYQKVVYETLPKYCNFCHVLGHTHLLCPKAAAAIKIVPYHQPRLRLFKLIKGLLLVDWVPSLLSRFFLLCHRCKASHKTMTYQQFLGGVGS